MLETWLQQNADLERQSRLDELKVRYTVIECWLGLLAKDELFVIRRHLVDNLDWMDVDTEFHKTRDMERAKTDRALQMYERQGIEKIVSFSKKHEEMIRSLFEQAA